MLFSDRKFNELGDINREIFRQRVEGTTCFILAAYSKK